MNLPPAEKTSKVNFARNRPEVIRASCDNCANSKVRCSKGQPRCQRCIYQGTECKYSPSQKCRKRAFSSARPNPPRDRSGGKTPRFESVSSTALPTPDATRSEPVSFPTPALEQPSHRIPEEEFKIPSSEPDHRDYTAASLFGTDVDSLLHWGELGVSPEEPPQSRPEMATLTDPPPLQPWMSQRRMDPYASLNDAELADFWTIPSKEPVSPAQTTRPRSRKDSTWESHRCFHLAIAAIQKLESPFTSCSPPCADPTTPAALPAGCSRSLDTVLKDNRSAIDSLFTILNCSCTAQTDLVLLIATISLRVLMWYQASLERSSSTGGSGSSTFNSAATALLSPSTATEPTSDFPSSSLVGWVSIPTINIGAYTLEAEHSARMVAQFILAELTKMKEVIDIFARKFCERGERMSSLYSSSSFPEGCENRLHLELEALLRSRLRRAVLTTREQLDRH